MKQSLMTTVCALYVFSLALVNIACAEQEENKSRAEIYYAKLCKIYGDELNRQEPATADSSYRLAMRLNQEVPELRLENKNISRAAPKDVYDLYKQAAEAAINKPWDCPAIKSYYQSDDENIRRAQ